MTVAEIWSYIQNGGIAGLLFIALIGVLRGWWVPGYQLREMTKDRDEWKDIAMENMHMASMSLSEIKDRRARATR